MSMFCGKCDFADTIEIYGFDFILNKCKVVCNGQELKLNKHSVIKYYPYIVGSMGMSKDGGFIHLSDESFVNKENKERLQWYIDDYKTVKKNKTPFFEDRIELTMIKNIMEDSALSSDERKKVLDSFLTSSAVFYKIELCQAYLIDYRDSNLLCKDVYPLLKEINDSFEIYKKYGNDKSLSYFQKFEEIEKEICRINFGTNKKM